MQKVSQEYKDSMKSLMRNRGYISIDFGLVNKELQYSSKVEDGLFTPFTQTKNIFNERLNKDTYGLLEQDFIRVDGSTMFLPRTDKVRDTGIVSRDLISTASPCEVKLLLDTLSTDFKGLSIQFGYNFPTEFEVITDTGQTRSYTNDSENWYCEDVFQASQYVRLIFKKMKYPNTRLRIYFIQFGYGLSYGNESVLNSSLHSFASPITKENSQVDFEVTLKNENHYFDVDNPNSAINYLETGQVMNVNYGYQLDDGTIEWVHGNTLLCSSWESNDTSATIRCQDVLRSMESVYSKGVVVSVPKSYYDLAIDVLKDAGIKDYSVDTRLKYLKTKNPIPRVKHKEALQIIANACRCYIIQDRFGKILIQPNFVPQADTTANEQGLYSNVKNIWTTNIKDEYADLSTDYSKVNDELRFAPRDISKVMSTGFVSKDVSKSDCTFTVNPLLTINFEAVRPYYGLTLKFGGSVAKEFTIRTYSRGTLTGTFNEINDSKSITLIHDFGELDKLEIEFTKTMIPQTRIVLNQLSISNTTNFEIGRNEMIGSPKIIKQELIKEVVVPSYTYQPNESTVSVVQADVEVVSGETQTYYLAKATYDYVAKLNDDDYDGVQIVDSSAFYVSVKFNRTGCFKLNVTAREYRVTEQLITRKLHNRGKTVLWKNPLMGDLKMAKELSEWLAEYYSSSVNYEYDYRGNPELDILDLIYQDNLFVDNMRVNIYDHVFNFKQSFSGSIKARRIED